MANSLELGLNTFGGITAGPDGHLLSHGQVIRNLVEEAVLADEVGVDFFGIGEHHRPDFAVSSPEVVLGVVAGCTKRIRLGSARPRQYSAQRNKLTVSLAQKGEHVALGK